MRRIKHQLCDSKSKSSNAKSHYQLLLPRLRGFTS